MISFDVPQTKEMEQYQKLVNKVLNERWRKNEKIIEEAINVALCDPLGCGSFALRYHSDGDELKVEVVNLRENPK